MSEQSKSSKKVFSNLNIISEQMQTLFEILTPAVDIKINRLKNELRQLLQILQISFQQSMKSHLSSKNSKEIRSFRDMIEKEIEFFDLTTKKMDLVINLDKHVFYKNIYAFVNRLKSCCSIRKEKKIRLVISQCLREIVLI